MEYHEAVNTLEGLRRVRPKMGTETTAALLDQLGNPHEGMAAVQIAGSNGKGSTAHTLSRILREAGVDVGLYTSPDLNDLRDRIQVGGQKIPKHEVTRFVDGNWRTVIDLAVAGDEPTFFEVFTALALWHFDRQDVDVAVLEVGIGGRYDATSVVDPVAAAVTSVSLEHTDILGSTVEEIARDKAQVAPDGPPLVTGATGEALESIRAETDVVTVGGEDADVSVSEEATATMSAVSIVGPTWEIRARASLLGPHQAVNAGIAATLARQIDAEMGLGIDDRDIAAGIRNTSIPGRFEVMGREPLAVLDGAHNPAACRTLAATMDRFDYDRLHLVFGAMRDKDHAAMCGALPALDRVYLAQPEVDRAQDTDTLEVVFDRESDARVDDFASVLGALRRALRAADADDCVLVTGSLYTVAEARDNWTQTPRVVNSDTAARARSLMESADVSPTARRACADRMVSRTVRFHARHEMATDLKETMLELGGTGSLSGIEAPDKHVEVLLTGTVAQFKELIRTIRGWNGGGRHFAARLNEALGIGVEEAPTDYPWQEGTAVMGILNVTPDSFHDGGRHNSHREAVAHAEEMVAAGADIVDVGGESTRPGAEPVSRKTEQERVVPVVESLADGVDAMVSVDTRKPTVAEAALEAGADMVNDVTGLADAAMRDVVADWGVPAVVMHSLSAPVDPNTQYVYDDVVDDVLEDLIERVLAAERAGIDRSQLIVDPGLGFGKRSAESFELLDRLREFEALGTPVMIGHSQKSMFERTTRGTDDRLAPTVAATALAAERGADVVRVHDVPENLAAIATAEQTTRRR